jgi:hypothetical protein
MQLWTACNVTFSFETVIIELLYLSDRSFCQVVLAEAHAALDAEWRETPVEPRFVRPEAAPLQAVKEASRNATCEWVWGDFVHAAVCCGLLVSSAFV